ncbi:MAG: autotransporter outer membrane beta-barrel domain-containing protein, partial [Acidaminococcaceae bacterium]|nr:autotransporter outer membrane beta-barrel domain-containing protein [Acidaminococcaceae bacterium]
NLILDNVNVMGAPKAEGGAIATGSESLPDVTATDVEVLTGAVANVKLNNHSSFNGKVEAGGTGVINMALDNTSTWGVTDTCKVNKLLNYGLVDMTVDNKYGTGLTVDELTGNGKIAMDVDFEAVGDVTRTDTVKVGSVDDDIRINVLPRFKNLLTGEAVLIFTGEGVEKLNSSNVTFNGENINGANKIDYGAFSYSVAFEEGWLTMLPDWKGTDVVLSAKGNAALSAVIDPETWYQDTEALFDNMDEFAADRAKQQIWAKYTNKKNTYDESFKGAVNCDVDKKYNGVVVGWDNRAKHFEKANADLYVGAMLTYGSGRYNWNDGSNDLDGKGVGLYTVYKTAKGAYVGATMKYNKYKFDEIKGNQHDGFNTPFKGDYDSNAYGIDLAAGRRYAKDLEDGFYVEPQIGLGYVRYNNGSYDLNAMDVDVNGMTSLRGRFGVQFGTHKQIGNGGFYDIFARVTLNREFKGKDDVKLDRAYNFEVDQSGTWVNFAIGTRVGNMNKFNVDLSANLSRGKHESKVGVKAGLNFMF